MKLCGRGVCLHIMRFGRRAEVCELEEVVEVIGGAAGNQFFGEPRNLHELNMPGAGIALKLAPSFNSWKRNIEDHRPARCLWKATDKGIDHDAAKIVTDKIGTL